MSDRECAVSLYGTEQDDIEAERQSVMENLKPEINAFLWSRLPPWITLGKAEKEACDLFDKIRDLWECKPGVKDE